MDFNTKIEWLLREQDGDMLYYDYIVMLAKTLNSQGLLPDDTKISRLAQRVLNTEKLPLTTDDESIPPIVIHTHFNEGDFSVDVVNLSKPSKRKSFQNTVSETIFDEVVDYIKQTQLQTLKDEDEPEPEPLNDEEPMPDQKAPQLGNEEIPQGVEGMPEPQQSALPRN